MNNVKTIKTLQPSQLQYHFIKNRIKKLLIQWNVISEICCPQFEIDLQESLMTQNSSSKRSQSREKTQSHKIFVTNLVGTANQKQLQSELTELFDRYGKIDNLVVKKSRNNEYCFAFVEYQPEADAEEAIRNLNNRDVRGKAMKVQFQDDSKRRKDPDKGCYTCGKKGHFARQCRSRNGSRGYRGRSRSRSRSRSDDRRKHRRRSYSESSEEHRDRSRHKKSKKHRSRDRDQKKKKKHKKHRHRSSSRSMS